MSNELQQLVKTAGLIILGKEKVIKLAVTCLLAQGHLLIEDVPGVGKTTLAHTLGKLLGLQYQRVQFTSDLLPADILGVSIFDRETNQFHFHQGPIFSELLLADEINRATPKTQSALLEAMEERQVSVEGETHSLPSSFFVIATQNPTSQIGTFALPESQLDRFLMRIGMGYPSREAERLLLAGQGRREMIGSLSTQCSLTQLQQSQAEVKKVFVSEALLDYCQALLIFSRESPRLHQGLSPRAGLGLLQAARAWALIDGRKAVLPEDIQAVFGSVASHRLHAMDEDFGDESESLADFILSSVDIP